MFSISEKKPPVYLDSHLEVKHSLQQNTCVDDRDFHIQNLQWLKALYIEAGGYHPCFGVSLTLFLNLFHEEYLDLAAYPRTPLGKLAKLKNNGLGIEEVEERLNLPFQIVENARDVFRERVAVSPKMKKFNLSIQEFVNAYQQLGLRWDYSSVTIFGGDTPLTKDYLKRLFLKKLKLRETSQALIQLAVDLLPPARMHDTDTHFYISGAQTTAGINRINHRICTVIEHISEKNLQRISREEVSSKCFSNYFKFPTSKASLITLGMKERTWDIISIWEADPQKIPYQFTNADLEFPIYNSEGHKTHAMRPECSKTDPWACIFHTILNISWLANYSPGREHPAINMGLFLKICIETTKGKMLLQNISGIAIDTFFQVVSNTKRFHEEVHGKLKHLKKSDAISTALSLNIMEFLGDITRENQEYLQVCIGLLPQIEDKKKVHTKITELISRYPRNTHAILNILKGSIIVSYVFQRIGQPDPEMEPRVKLTILDGMPGLTYLIDGCEEAHFSFKIEPQKTFESIMKTHVIHDDDKEFLSELTTLYILCTEDLKPRPLPPVHLNTTLAEEFCAIGIREESFFSVILNLIHSENPLCCDMAFHLLRLAKLWNLKQIKSLAKQSLKSSAPLYPGLAHRKTRSALEANTLSGITEDELMGIIFPQKPRFKQGEAFSNSIEKDILQLKSEINKKTFDQLLEKINKAKTEENSLRWQKATCQLVFKLSNIQNPISATFDSRTRKQFEKTIYHFLRFLLKQNELRSAIQLFKWSLDQGIFLYNWASWVFITDDLLSRCSEETLEHALEPILAQFPHHLHKEAFQHFLLLGVEKQEKLQKSFPHWFLASKSAVDSELQVENTIASNPHKNAQTANNVISNKTDNKKAIVGNLSKGFIVVENNENQNEQTHKTNTLALKKKLENLYRKIDSKSKKRSRKSSLKTLSFAFNIQSFEDPKQNQQGIPAMVYNWDDELKILFIKTTYNASKYITNTNSKKFAIEQLFFFWRKNKHLNIGREYEDKFFYFFKQQRGRYQSLSDCLSKISNFLLKPLPGLLLSVGFFYCSTLLIQRLFSYEEEYSLAERIINDVALQTIQSVGEHCLTFYLPLGSELKNCFESESELYLAEEQLTKEYPIWLLHGGHTYTVQPAQSGAKFTHRLVKNTFK